MDREMDPFYYPTEDSIKKWMRRLPDYPNRTLKDIEITRENVKEQRNYKRRKRHKSSSLPSSIINDWLYLGTHQHCNSVNVIQDLGITHILNCSDNIPCYFLFDEEINVKYARIPIVDWEYANCYKYFHAITQFIDECNPLYNNNNNKILVHCEVGKSRSSAIIIAYLMAKEVKLNDLQRIKFDFIRNGLKNGNDEYDDNIKRELKEKIDENIIVSMKLNEAYFYVKTCRDLIKPNNGFILQLEKWEKIRHDETTLSDIPKYTKNKQIKKLAKTAAKIRIDQYGNIEINSNSCVLL